MKTVNIRLVVVLGTVSIISIILFQGYWVYNTINITDRQFNQRARIALYAVAEELADFNKTELPYDPVTQVTSNYFVVNMASKIDAKILEHYLWTILNQHNLQIDIEYAIYNCETDLMAYGNYLPRKGDELPRGDYQSNFEKQENLVYYFGVIFPTKNNFILQNMNIWFVSTIIIVIALAFFSYALFIILRQKKLSEIQKDFIDNMTHEFKTPISSIAIAAHVLSEPGIENDPLRLKRYADIITQQQLRLEGHVEKVLQVASFERKKDRLQPGEFDLHECILEVIRSSQFTQDQAVVTTDLQAANPVILADRLHMTNILYNLLDNALKYCTADPRIVIATQENSKEINLIISDNGIGIEGRYQKRIFDKFFRVPTGNIHTVKGFGIGLYYVRRIVEMHGWSVKVRSEIGKGTSISINIPRKHG